MSTRRRHLVCYDIRDEKRLRDVHKAMTGWGDPLQYSVFVCDLNGGELITMRANLESLIHHAADSVLIVDLGELDASVGRFQFIGQRLQLPGHGARIL